MESGGEQMWRIQLVPLARENERKGRRGEGLENGPK